MPVLCALILLALALALPPVYGASFARLALELGAVSHPAFSAQDIRLRLDARDGTGVLSIGRMRAGGREWRALALRCGRVSLDSGVLACVGASVHVAGRRLALAADVEATLGAGPVRIALRFPSGARVDGRMDAEGKLRVRLQALGPADIEALAAPWQPEHVKTMRDYKPGGALDAELEWTDAGGGESQVAAQGRLTGGLFGSADGLLGAEGLAIDVALDGRGAGRSWSWSARADWHGGAAYVHPLLIEAGAGLRASGRIDGDRVRVDVARLALDGVDAVTARAVFDRARGAFEVLEVDIAGAELAHVGPRWLAPLLAPVSAPRLRFGGRADARLAWRAGRLDAVELALNGAGFGVAGTGLANPPEGGAAREGGELLALGPICGGLHWSARRPGRATLQVEGGRWERLALGAFTLDAELGAGALRLAAARIPLLDGALVVEDVALAHGDEGWQGSASVVLEPVSMPLLSAALGLPRMAGVMSAALPSLQFTPGELTLGGELVVSVFDGWLQASGLRLREPFGIASHLVGDIQARHIDLAQLTETFSFGSISGHVDAEVRGLELSHWRPTAFDARIASIEGGERRRISQRAVESISALGGGGAVAAVQRSLLRVFDTFGYSELGLRCRLAAGICEMGGLEGADRADGGFVIIRGGGVPALDVIGYNRRVDWNELVDRLQRVVAGGVPATIQ